MGGRRTFLQNLLVWLGLVTAPAVAMSNPKPPGRTIELWEEIGPDSLVTISIVHNGGDQISTKALRLTGDELRCINQWSWNRDSTANISETFSKPANISLVHKDKLVTRMKENAVGKTSS